MPFLRLTRDRRGYENTFLLHAAHPGEQPRVLYWYRSAPAVRVGRPPLDEDAIRTIEEQHPEIDFDWPHILEVGAAQQPEVEEQLVRQPRRRQGKRRDEGETAGAPPRVTEPPLQDAERPAAAVVDVYDAGPGIRPGEDVEEVEEELEAPVARAHDLLEELAGREIATRLHARYAEIIARIHRLPGDHAQRDAWQARAEALNPDNWVTPAEVLAGVQRADELFDVLRRELLTH